MRRTQMDEETRRGLLARADELLCAGSYSDALPAYNKLPQDLKRSADVQIRLGACRFAQGDLHGAMRVLKRALAAHARNDDIAAFLARCYREYGWFELSRSLACEILGRNPECLEALRAAFLSSFDLRDIEGSVKYAQALLQKRNTPEHRSLYLYMLLFTFMPAEELAREHLRVGATYSPGTDSVLPCKHRVRGRGERIRVGYVSAMFGVHAECFEPMFRWHDRTRFEVHAFADRFGAYTPGERMLARLCDYWHNITELSNAKLDEYVKTNGIDVLVDCDGHFHRGERLELYARRTAPVQISFLYPSYTGVQGLDYRITDRHLAGGKDRWLPTETPIELPVFACRLPPAKAPAVDNLPALRNGYVTFGGFAPPMKLNTRLIAVWARILREVPKSRLLLHGKMGPENGRPFRDLRAHLTKLFAEQGIPARRLRFESNRPLADHMKLYDCVDLMLDPFPHNGMRTTILSLYMGVPVLTVPGESGVSRMGLSLLTEAGLADWVARSADEYISLAAAKAGDLRALARLRSGLRKQVAVSPLMDGERWTRAFEAAIEAIVHRDSKMEVFK